MAYKDLHTYNVFYYLNYKFIKNQPIYNKFWISDSVNRCHKLTAKLKATKNSQHSCAINITFRQCDEYC